MKPLIAILSVIIIFSFYACNDNSTDTQTQSKTELLTRTWVLDSCFRNGELQSEFIGNRVEFSKNLIIKMYLKTGDVFTGTWELNEKTNIVNIKVYKDSSSSHVSNYSFIIDKLTDNDLEWHYTDGGYLFREVYKAFVLY